jgi:hypothetical protein
MRARSWLWVVALGGLLGGRHPVAAADEPVSSSSSPVNGNLHFRNDASPKFELLEARFAIDGDPLPTVITNAPRGKDYIVVAAPLSPGYHVVTAELLYRPKERKVFTYLNGYRFNVRSDEVLTALPDHSATFTIVGTDSKGLNTPMDKALAVTVETNIAPPEPGDTIPRPNGAGGDELP